MNNVYPLEIFEDVIKSALAPEDHDELIGRGEEFIMKYKV